MLLRNLQIVEELSHWKDNSFILRCSREKGEKDLGSIEELNDESDSAMQ